MRRMTGGCTGAPDHGARGRRQPIGIVIRAPPGHQTEPARLRRDSSITGGRSWSPRASASLRDIEIVRLPVTQTEPARLRRDSSITGGRSWSPRASASLGTSKLFGSRSPRPSPPGCVAIPRSPEAAPEDVAITRSPEAAPGYPGRALPGCIAITRSPEAAPGYPDRPPRLHRNYSITGGRSRSP